MDSVELKIVDIKNSSVPSEAFALLLKEKEGDRHFPIIIGIGEAKNMILILNKIESKRPGTHQLFRQFILDIGFRMENMLIYRYDEGIYYSYIVLKNDKETIKLDSRTSDAVSMALLFDAPIFIDPAVLNNIIAVDNDIVQEYLPFSDEIAAEDDDTYEEKFIEQKIRTMSDAELEDLLEGAVQSEDFELAVKIQEEQQRRTL